MNCTKLEAFEAHFKLNEDQKRAHAQEIANNFAYGINGYPLSLVDAFYWNIIGRVEKGAEKLETWQRENRGNQYVLKDVLPAMVTKLKTQVFMSLITKRPKEAEQRKLFEDAMYEYYHPQQKKYVNIYLYWVAGVIEPYNSYNAAVLYYKIHCNNKNRAPHELRDNSFAALIRLCEMTSSAMTRTSLLIRIYLQNRTLTPFIPYIDQRLISSKDAMKATKEQPHLVADLLLHFAIECEVPDPVAVMESAKRYGDPQSSFDEIKYAAKLLYQQFSNQKFGHQDRTVISNRLFELHATHPNHPYVTYQTGRLYTKLGDPLKGYELIMQVRSMLDIPPETFCEIADIIKQKITSPKPHLQKLDAVMQKCLIIASDLGSSRACLDLAELFEHHIYYRISWVTKGLKLAYLKTTLKKETVAFANDDYRKCFVLLAHLLHRHPVPYDPAERMHLVLRAHSHPLGYGISADKLLSTIEDEPSAEHQTIRAMSLTTDSKNPELKERVRNMINDFRCLEHLKNVSESNNVSFTAEQFGNLENLLLDDLNVYFYYRDYVKTDNSKSRRRYLENLKPYVKKGNIAALCAMCTLDPKNRHYEDNVSHVARRIDRLNLIHLFALANQKHEAFFIFQFLNKQEVKQQVTSANLRAYIEIYHGLLTIIQPTFNKESQPAAYEEVKRTLCSHHNTERPQLQRNSSSHSVQNTLTDIFTESTKVLRRHFLLDTQERQLNIIIEVIHPPPLAITPMQPQPVRASTSKPITASAFSNSSAILIPNGTRSQKSSPRVRDEPQNVVGSPVESKSFGKGVNLRKTPLKARPRSRDASQQFDTSQLANQHRKVFERVLSVSEDLASFGDVADSSPTNRSQSPKDGDGQSSPNSKW